MCVASLPRFLEPGRTGKGGSAVGVRTAKGRPETVCPAACALCTRSSPPAVDLVADDRDLVKRRRRLRKVEEASEEAFEAWSDWKGW